MHLSPRAAALVLLAVLTVSACNSASNPTGPGTAAPRLSRAAVPAPSAGGSSSAASARHEAPCARNARPRWVLVSLREQHLWMCAGHRLVRQTPITSGRLGGHNATPTGTYRIQGLNRDSLLVPGTGVSYPVKYWIPFDAPLFGFHDSPWQHFPYGSPVTRTRGSHGCVHMPLRAIRFLYHWAEIGTAVRIRP